MQTDLYNAILNLLPYKKDKKSNYFKRLKSALDEYQSLLSDYGCTESLLKEVEYISRKIKEIVTNYEKGQQSTSFVQLQNLIQGKKGIKPKIDISKMLLPFDDSRMSFYRIRKLDSIYEIEAKDMFHIPLDKRGIVKTQRYSAIGYPCLYLGESIYGCWEEMRRPSMEKCAVSRLECSDKLKIIDLTIPSYESIKDENYLKLIPLIISCMIPVVNHDDTYKPEYIIPQLIIEWVLKNRHKGIDGVCYTSTHINDEFSFPKEKFVNYAIPVYNVSRNNKYCKKLCELFKITKPTTNEIEKLKCGYSIDCRKMALNEEKRREQNYKSSDFGNLEERLMDKDEFELYSINFKS